MSQACHIALVLPVVSQGGIGWGRPRTPSFRMTYRLANPAQSPTRGVVPHEQHLCHGSLCKPSVAIAGPRNDKSQNLAELAFACGCFVLTEGWPRKTDRIVFKDCNHNHHLVSGGYGNSPPRKMQKGWQRRCKHRTELNRRGWLYPLGYIPAPPRSTAQASRPPLPPSKSGWNRTSDRRVRNSLLFPLSYGLARGPASSYRAERGDLTTQLVTPTPQAGCLVDAAIQVDAPAVL